MKAMDKEEFIRIKEWPITYAEKAYKRKRYIEAIQVLHGFMETKVQELLILLGTTSYNRAAEDIWDIANQVSLINCAKVLYILGQVEQADYQSILKFNSMRNQLVHTLFHEPFDEGVKGVSKKLFDDAFVKGIAVCKLLQRKSEDMIEIT